MSVKAQERFECLLRLDANTFFRKVFEPSICVRQYFSKFRNQKFILKNPSTK